MQFFINGTMNRTNLTKLMKNSLLYLIVLLQWICFQNFIIKILIHMLQRSVRLFSTAKKTCLYDTLLQSKGKMVDFAGYYLPVQFPQGIIKQHLHCRENASIFDVSHMGQILLSGPDRLKLLERSTVGSTERKSKNDVNECYLSLFLNEKAGIIDDCIATILPHEQKVRIVVNGANKYIVMKHLNELVEKEKLMTRVQLFDDNGLIAVQGPKSPHILQQVFKDVDFSQIPFMSYFKSKFEGDEYIITRSGYTGEDGFEIAGNGPQIVKITQRLLQNPILQWAGLGSRDSLRLQAGLCLHGHDMTPQITPLEATLMWTVFKRKENSERLKFIGEDTLKQLQDKVKAKEVKIKKRVGFMVEQPGIIRENCQVIDANENRVGYTSSGSYSPSLKKSIGMAYVDQGFAKEGTKLTAVQRGKKHKIGIVKMPFVPSGYYKGWKDF